VGKEVHRNLVLVSPAPSGPDVEELQHAVDHIMVHYKFAWWRVRADGELGPHTMAAAARAAWLIGLDDSRVEAINGKNGHRQHIAEPVQHLLRNPDDRAADDRKREDDRKHKREALHEEHNTGSKAAVDWAIKQVGVHEVPAGSNRGPKIDDWIAYWFGTAQNGVYWCGVFAGYAVKKIGGGKVTTWLPYGPSIINDARAVRGGLRSVAFEDAQPGDLLVYWGGEHIGLCRERPSGGMINTVEGNTSSASGSQSNGGEVALKTRAKSDVTVVARPDY